jgi:hypothetical protein
MVSVNAWQEYGGHYKTNKVPKRTILNLLGCKMAMRETLVASPKHRIQQSSENRNNEQLSIRYCPSSAPCNNKLHGFYHWLVADTLNSDQRSKPKGCLGTI